MKKCGYCGKSIPDYKEYCDEQCAAKAEQFEKFAKKRMVPFGVLIALSTLTILASSFVFASGSKAGSMMMGCGILLLGITAVLFPFATPQTVAMAGIKKAVFIVRALGLAIIVSIIVIGIFTL